MDQVSLSQLARWCSAELAAGDPALMAAQVAHDTRVLKKGDLYIALRGEHFDGNSFLLEAAQKGAVGALCDGCIPQGLPKNFGILRVADSLKALRELAFAWRQELGLRSIVITGSNGKTTTKDFTTALLSSLLRTTSTKGNFNNNIGLPLSILDASRADQIAVWEIGMNHRGEIAPLAALARPDIAIITNIGIAHIGFLGSREAIAEEKGDLLPALSKDGVAILPAADPFFETLSKRTTARIFSVGVGCGMLRAENIVSTDLGSEFEVHYQGASHKTFLPVIGEHMVNNALFALAAGIECGLSLEQGIEVLKKSHPSKRRLALQQINDVTLIDDSYNANPDSMKAALRTVNAFTAANKDSRKSRRIGVLGRMGELGDYENEGYRSTGEIAATTLDILIAVGKETAPLAQAAREAGLKAVHEIEDRETAAVFLSSLVQPGDVVLVKGSLSAAMGDIVAHFVAEQKTSRKNC